PRYSAVVRALPVWYTSEVTSERQGSRGSGDGSMGDEQQADEQRDQAQASADEAPVLQWGDPISLERQAELQRRLDAWATEQDHGARRGPFSGGMQNSGRISLTGADVFWLAERVRREAGTFTVPGLHLEGANLHWAHLEGAELTGAHLEGAVLTEADLQSSVLIGTQLQGALLLGARLERAILRGAYLEGANLREAQLQAADLTGAQLEGADLRGAQLQGTDLTEAQLERAILTGAQLQGANLGGASFDKASRLNGAHLHGVLLDQVILDNTNLAVVEWGEVRRLGDERLAKEGSTSARVKSSDSAWRAGAYRSAARAYRSLSVALRAQGLAAHATRFHYRAELMDRYALHYEMRKRLFTRRVYTVLPLFLRWLGSWGLGTFAGYGDYVGRLFLTYAVVVASFTLAMFVAGQQTLSPDHVRDALVLSVTSFHGRGLQPPGLPLSDAIATLAGAEAVFGLLIEGIFIAAFTRRVTGN
ncbi:MAG TPA: pentapeptide repeat-containing protein, partial [Ktedonobacterales bacterium]|nr:pentapeptide repeat-containing protein [Ktedonobacterales bacterium]